MMTVIENFRPHRASSLAHRSVHNIPLGHNKLISWCTLLATRKVHTNERFFHHNFFKMLLHGSMCQNYWYKRYFLIFLSLVRSTNDKYLFFKCFFNASCNTNDTFLLQIKLVFKARNHTDEQFFNFYFAFKNYEYERSRASRD